MMYTTQWVLDTVSQLPEKEMGQLTDYLEFLVWKAKSDNKEKTQAQKIIDGVEQSDDVTIDDALFLLNTIKQSQKPVRFNSPFTPSSAKERKFLYHPNANG